MVRKDIVIGVLVITASPSFKIYTYQKAPEIICHRFTEVQNIVLKKIKYHLKILGQTHFGSELTSLNGLGPREDKSITCCWGPKPPADSISELSAEQPHERCACLL